MTYRKFEGAVISALLAVSLAACSATGSDGTPPPVVSPATKAAPLFEQLRADAAQRAQVPLVEVQLISEERVAWRDGALGCPEPDRMYTQAVVPGYRFRVQAGRQVLVYHADQRGRWILCPPGRGEDPLRPAQ
jgi:hypothetical protein